MILENGLKIYEDGFRSIDPLTGKIDKEVSTKGRVNPKTGKFVKPVIIEYDSLTSFEDMPKEAYNIMSENDMRVVKLFLAGRSRETWGLTTSTDYAAYLGSK